MKASPMLLVAGVAGLAFLLLRKREGGVGLPPEPPVLPPPPIWQPPTSPVLPYQPVPSPLPVVPEPSDLIPVLGADIARIDPGAKERNFGDVVRLTVVWVARTRQRNGEGLEWNYRVYAGIGRPESPLFGRQFATEGPTLAQQYSEVRWGYPTITVFEFPLWPELGYATGLKDIMVSVLAAPNPWDKGDGRDVSGIWPHVSADEWREVASVLAQDAVEITVGGGPALVNQRQCCPKRVAGGRLVEALRVS